MDPLCITCSAPATQAIRLVAGQPLASSWVTYRLNRLAVRRATIARAVRGDVESPLRRRYWLQTTDTPALPGMEAPAQQLTRPSTSKQSQSRLTMENSVVGHVVSHERLFVDFPRVLSPLSEQLTVHLINALTGSRCISWKRDYKTTNSSKRTSYVWKEKLMNSSAIGVLGNPHHRLAGPTTSDWQLNPGPTYLSIPQRT